MPQCPAVEDLVVALTEKYSRKKLLFSCIAEIVGTFLLVFFGLGFTSNAVLMGAQVGLFEAAFLWGLALTVAIYCTASISTAHLNPAVSVALCVFRSKEFGPVSCLLYISSQIVGAFLASSLVFGMFQPHLLKYEETHGIVRGSVESIGQAAIYGQFFPNPAMIPHTSLDSSRLPGGTAGHAFAVEFVGTLLLMFLILAIVDKNQNTLKNKELVPLVIGLALTSIVAVIGPSTEACLNPARDFGARLVSAAFGYGKLALPGPNNEVFVYFFAPILGALAGALLHDLLIAPGLRRSAKPYDTYQAKVHDLQLQRSMRDMLLASQRSSQESSSSEDFNPDQQGAILAAVVAAAAKAAAATAKEGGGEKKFAAIS